MEKTLMQCETSTLKVPFSFEIDVEAERISITSDAGHIHQYKLSALRDTYNWLCTANNRDWVLLGSINEQNNAVAGSVEAWARDPANPAGGFYGTTPNFRGRFASYIPAILEKFGFVELEGLERNNRVRAK